VAEEGGMMQLQRRCINALLLGLLAVAAGAACATAARAASENPLAAQPLELLSDTRERPLFAPTRRPPPPPPPPVVQRVEPPAPVPPPNVILLGVVTDENGARAVVRSASPDKIVRARLGEEIEGWQVTQIEPRRVVLSHDARSVSFALFGRLKDSVVRDAAPAAAEVELRNMAQEHFDRRTGRY
jgi:general secretion pathway protein N